MKYIESVFEFINNLPRDKKDHALMGLVVYSVIALISPISALLTVLTLGIGKEVYDNFNSAIHTTDIYDTVATVAIPTVLYAIVLIKDLA